MIERAYKKLALDALVIQQGRLAEQKSMAFLFLKLFGAHVVVDIEFESLTDSVFVVLCSCEQG